MRSFSSASDGFYKPPRGPLASEREKRRGQRGREGLSLTGGNSSVEMLHWCVLPSAINTLIPLPVQGKDATRVNLWISIFSAAYVCRSSGCFFCELVRKIKCRKT